MNMRLVAVLVAVILLSGGGLWLKRTLDAARPQGDDTAQIRQMLINAEAAAERREPSGVSKYLSEDYRDDVGFSDSSMRYQIGHYLRKQREVNINIASQSVQVQVEPGGRTGSVSFLMEIAVGGTNSPIQTTVPMSLRLKKDPVRYLWFFPGEEWRVTSADGYQGVPD